MGGRKRKTPKVEHNGSDDCSVVFMQHGTAWHDAREARDGQVGDNQAVANDHQQTVRDMIEGFREELAQTYNPRFEVLEHHILNINARLAIGTDSANIVATASSEGTTTNRHATALVPKEDPTAVARNYADLVLPAGSFFSTPVLTNFGYECLLRQIDFRDITQWASLARLDNLVCLRDCTLFCDLTFIHYYVDYVIRIGGTAKHISEDVGSPRGMGPDIQGLRIFEIEYSQTSLKDAHTFREWSKNYDPPQFVYEIGQLFLRRQCKRTTKQDLFHTDFNVVMDVAKPSKPLWLIARPGGSVVIRNKGHENSSSKAFNHIGSSSVALLSRSIQEFSLTTAPSDQTSYGRFQTTNGLAIGSKLEISLEFHKADVSSIESTIKKRWPVEQTQRP